MSNGNPQRCPECGLSDRVVRARVSDRVSPPVLHLGNPQVYESPWGCFSVGFVFLSYAVFLFFLVIVFLRFASVPGVRPGDVVPGLLVTFTLAVIAFFIMIHHAKIARTSQAEVTQYNAELQNRNKTAQERYDDEIRVYEEDLYYCERDDVVFVRD
jgi:hypothetical protein